MPRKKTAKPKCEHPAVGWVKDAIRELQVFVQRWESGDGCDVGHIDTAEDHLQAAHDELDSEG